MSDYYSEHLTFDGDNSFPDCEGCGKCCEYMYVMAVTPEELQRMKDYVAEHNIQPIDYNRTLCPFRGQDGLCRIWEARPQICKLHHCKVPRTEILRQNPSIQVPDDLPLVDLYDVFFKGDDSDPRYRKKPIRPSSIVLAVVLFLVVLLTSMYFCASSALGLGHLLTPTEVGQLLTTGSIQDRTQVAAPIKGYTESASPLSYEMLYKDKSAWAQVYQRSHEAYVGFQEFNEDQQLTWIDAGCDVGTAEAASSIGSLWRQMMSDDPCYSVQYPSTPVGATEEGSHEVVTAGNRFMVRSLYLQPTTKEALVYYQQVCDKVQQLSAQALVDSDGSTRGYIEKCFSLLASGMVYSDGGDEGPWYSNNIYGALIGGESECAGMSDALKALLDVRGIPNFVATGQVQEGGYGHAWNVVYLDGEWLVCDLTRCVGDVVVIDRWGAETRTTWKIGNVPELDTESGRMAAGFLIPQDDYLSGESIVADDGRHRYSFGGSIAMDQASYRLESAYEQLMSGL